MLQELNVACVDSARKGQIGADGHVAGGFIPETFHRTADLPPSRALSNCPMPFVPRETALPPVPPHAKPLSSPSSFFPPLSAYKSCTRARIAALLALSTPRPSLPSRHAWGTNYIHARSCCGRFRSLLPSCVECSCIYNQINPHFPKNAALLHQDSTLKHLKPRDSPQMHRSSSLSRLPGHERHRWRTGPAWNVLCQGVLYWRAVAVMSTFGATHSVDL